MPDMGEKANQYRGNRPDQYKQLTPDKGEPKSEFARVRVINEQIKRAQALLRFTKRQEAVDEAVEYLTNQKVVKNAKKTYMPYLFPMLEDAHRRTFPAVPSPRIEETNELVAGFADRIRELVTSRFTSPRCGVRRASEQAQWDDDLYGDAILKTVWRVKQDPAEPSRVTDPSQLEPQVAKAMEENLDPAVARIADEDIHQVHYKVHFDELSAMSPEDVRDGPLNEHMAAHEAAMVSVRREYPKVVRVSPTDFVFDDDVPFEDRTWDAERLSLRVRDMLEMGYKNVNTTNLKVEDKDKETLKNWEDMTAQVWQYHDRRDGKMYIVPVNGTDEGLFLFQGDWPYGSLDIYVPVVFHPFGPDQLDGAPLVAQCIPTLERLAVVDFHIDRHVRRHADYKMLFPKGSVSDKDKGKLNDPNVASLGLPPEAILGMKEEKPPPIPETLLKRWQMLMDNLRKLVGADAQDTGENYAHQISATESATRSQSSDSRLDTRQETLGLALARVAVNFLQLQRMFSTKNLTVPNTADIAPEAPPFLQVDPSDIPEDIELFFDLKGESDEARTIEFANTRTWGDVAMAAGYPMDIVQYIEYLGRRGGVRRPEQFRQQLVESGGIAPQSPGVPGEANGAGAPGQPGQNIPFPEQQAVEA